MVGETDIDNYEYGDMYLNKITPYTTVAELVANCDTNGEMIVLDSNGDEVSADKYVGTGMTIKTTGYGEEFVLTAVVMGDLDGNGKLSVTDLSVMNHVIVRTQTLQGAFFEAADLDDSNRITATDLSTINQALVRTIELTYTKPN